MIWFMIFVLWSLRVVLGDSTAASPTMKVLMYLIALLGVLQVVVSTIDLIEFTMAILSG